MAQVTLEYPREGVRWSLDADAGQTLKEPRHPARAQSPPEK